MDKTLKTTITF
jgi:hypothetical protein